MNWTGQRLRRNPATKCSMKKANISNFAKVRCNVCEQAKKASPFSWESLDLYKIHNDSYSNSDNLTKLELESSSKPLELFNNVRINVLEKANIPQNIERNKVIETPNSGQHQTVSSVEKLKACAPQSVTSNNLSLDKKQEDLSAKKQRIIKQEDWVGIKTLKSKLSSPLRLSSMNEHGTLKSNSQFKNITYQLDKKQIKLPTVENLCIQSRDSSKKSDIISSVGNQDMKPNISNAKYDKNESIIQETTCEASRSMALKSKFPDIKTSTRNDLTRNVEGHDTEYQKRLVNHHLSSKNQMEMAVKTQINNPNNPQEHDPQKIYFSDFKVENCPMRLYKTGELDKASVSFSSASLRHPIPRSSKISHLLDSSTLKNNETLGAPRNSLDLISHHNLKFHEDNLMGDNLSSGTLFARDIERGITSSGRKSCEIFFDRGSSYDENRKLSRAKIKSKHPEVDHEFDIESFKKRFLSITPPAKVISPNSPSDILRKELSGKTIRKPTIIDQKLVVPQENSTASCISKAKSDEIWRSFVFGNDEK